MHLNKILEQIKRHQSPTEAIELLTWLDSLLMIVELRKRA